MFEDYADKIAELTKNIGYMKADKLDLFNKLQNRFFAGDETESIAFNYNCLNMGLQVSVDILSEVEMVEIETRLYKNEARQMASEARGRSTADYAKSILEKVGIRA